ncbi:MAG TPA: signal peptidase I [Candidatus Bathyarchaeia archaeon]|nr:signal peptidase I [Candidatus Bathyarchaeia archaeon]
MSEKTNNSTVRTVFFGRESGYIAFILLSVPVIYLFGFRHMSFFRVPSASMEPTLMAGDHLITLTADQYQRGEVVVTEDPEEEGAFIVKRIVAVSGDTVAVEGGALYVNGHYVSEPYVKTPPQYLMPPFKLPDGNVFLLGDNRNNSEDAHAWPDKAQPVDNIIGKVRFIYYPYERAGRFTHFALGGLGVILAVGFVKCG